MIKCKECKKEISSDAKTCPHCGISSPVESTGSLTALFIVGYVITMIFFYFIAHQNEDAGSEEQQETRKKMADETSYQVIANQAIQSIAKQRNWSKVELQTANRYVYVLIIWYKNAPSGTEQVKEDTSTVAKALLAQLINAGFEPIKDMISIQVLAQMEGGDTENETVRNLGKTIYDFNNDELQFKQ
jgi:hypothetical protein